MFKRHIDGDRELFKSSERSRFSHPVREALLADDWEGWRRQCVAHQIANNWPRTLPSQMMR
jgi:hypothetical protein